MNNYDSVWIKKLYWKCFGNWNRVGPRLSAGLWAPFWRVFQACSRRVARSPSHLSWRFHWLFASVDQGNPAANLRWRTMQESSIQLKCICYILLPACDCLCACIWIESFVWGTVSPASIALPFAFMLPAGGPRGIVGPSKTACQGLSWCAVGARLESKTLLRIRWLTIEL